MPLRLLFLLAWFAPSALAQTSVFGRVTDFDTGAALPGIYLLLTNADHTEADRYTWADDEGRYALTGIADGRWLLQAVWRTEGLRFTLTTPPFTLGDAPLLLHFALPTDEKAWLGPSDPRPFQAKDLRIITGITTEGRITNDEGVALPGSTTLIQTVTTGTLEGRVWKNNRPVDGATVLLSPTGQTAQTAASGHFLFDDLAPGHYHLQISQDADTLDLSDLDIRKGLNELHIEF